MLRSKLQNSPISGVGQFVAVFLTSLILTTSSGQSVGDREFTVLGVESNFEWDVLPANWNLKDSLELEVLATSESDLFIDPEGEYLVSNASRALFSPDSVFQFKALVEVDFQSDFDAGVLLLFKDEQHWAKLCFEYSPQGEAMVVSVVTNGVSDDSNALVIPDNRVYLRISGLPKSFAFHYSYDGQDWHFVRYFSLGDPNGFRVGLLAQSPIGKGCKMVFSEINYSTTKLLDLRNGK